MTLKQFVYNIENYLCQDKLAQVPRRKENWKKQKKAHISTIWSLPFLVFFHSLKTLYRSSEREMTVFYPTGPRSCSQLSSSTCASDQVRSARNGEESFKPGNGNENQWVIYRFLVTKELPALAHC